MVKRFSALFMLLLLTSSCSLVSDSWYGSKLSGMELFYYHEFYTVGSIPAYIGARIDYRVDGGVDVWSGPENTFYRRYGDCEDIALLYLNILYISKGIKGNLLLVDVPRLIVGGGEINHAVIEVDGVQIEPQTGTVVNYRIGYRYTFNEIFF